MLPLSERLPSLGLMEAELGAPFKPLNTIVLWWSELFQGGLQLFPHDADRRFSDSYMSDIFLIFQSGIVSNLFIHRKLVGTILKFIIKTPPKIAEVAMMPKTG